MNKRIRKKKQVGEFTEWGFTLAWRRESDNDPTWERDILFYEELVRVIEPHGLIAGGSCGGKVRLFVTHCDRPYEKHRRCRSAFVGRNKKDVEAVALKYKSIITNFLESKPFIDAIWMSPLVNVSSYDWNIKIPIREDVE